MERVFICCIIPPGAPAALLDAWAAHGRACVPAAALVAAMHARTAAALGATLRRLGVDAVAVPDAVPCDAPPPLPPGGAALDDDTLRRCYAWAALMRVRVLQHCAAGGPAGYVWFLAPDACDPGDAARLARIRGHAAEHGAACYVSPRPDAAGRRAVIVDTPATPRAPARIAIIDAGVAAARFGGECFRVRAAALRGFDWAIAPLAVFACCPMRVGQVPVTTLWVPRDAAQPAATASAPLRVGEDFGWFWDAHAKNVPVFAAL